MDARSWWRDGRVVVAAGVVLPLVVAVALVPLRGDLPNTAAALVMVVAVVAVATTGRRTAGWLAAASATFWFDLFLTAPFGRLAIAGRDDVETTVLLLAVGIAVTELAVRGRRHRTTAVVRTTYLSDIAATAAAAAAGGPPDQVLAHVRDDLARLLAARTVRFERSVFGGLPRLLADGRVQIPDGEWDVAAAGLPALGLEVLAERNGRCYGRFVVTPGPDARPDRTARQVAKILADQAATALAGERRPSPAPRRAGHEVAT